VDNQAPVVLIIRDGWGQNPDSSMDEYNAIIQANTPVADTLGCEWPTTLIGTCGEHVGLPAGVMGNSEVGHQNIGAGRIVPQELMRLNHAAECGDFHTNNIISELFSRGNDGHVLHVIGLLSDGRIHSDFAHLFAFLDAAPKGTKICIHVITDGRDCSPTSAIGFVETLEKHIHGTNTTIASVMGRYWAMDRDNRWERVALAFEAMTGRRASHPLREELPHVGTALSPSDVIGAYYKNPSDPSQTGDEFIVPTQIVNSQNEPLGVVRDGDAVFFFNYRGDRPRELSRAFVLNDDAWSRVPRGPFCRGNTFDDLYFVTMTNYDKNLPVSAVAFDKPAPMKHILGDVLASNKLQQFRCAETEKFPHITFFFNDYQEEPFKGETRLLVPSPTDVSTYDQKPQMSAEKVCKGVVEQLADERCPAVIIVNFANVDMVGHTGKLPAIIKAVEVVDACCGQIIDATLNRGGSLVITADHGNAERTWDVETNSPDTAHTTYDVPLHVVGEQWKTSELRKGGVLADIAPTLLHIINLPKPQEMTGESLIQ